MARNDVSGTWVLQQVKDTTDLGRQKPNIDAALALPGMRGYSLRCPWASIDTSLSLFDAGKALPAARGQAFSVRFMAGVHTPARIFDIGAYHYLLDGRRCPKPFADDGTPGNPVFEREYEAATKRAAAWCRANGVKLLHLPWYGRLWAEIDAAAETVGRAKGWSYAGWLTGHKNLVDIASRYVGDDLAIEFALSGYWGTNAKASGELVTYARAKLGANIDWSQRFYVQSNVLGGKKADGSYYNANPVGTRPVHHGLQMYGTGDYDWPVIYRKLYEQRSTYVEVYTPSFSGANRAGLAAEVKRFAAHVGTWA